jgi:hypothetical protein
MTDRHATIGYMVKNFFLFDSNWGVHNNCGDLSCGSGQWGMDYQWYKDCPFSWIPCASTKTVGFNLQDPNNKNGFLNVDFIECRANQSFPSQSVLRASMGILALHQSVPLRPVGHLCADVYLDHFTYPANEWMKLALVLLVYEGTFGREQYFEANLKESPKVHSYMPYNNPAAGEAYSDTFIDLPMQTWTHIDVEIEKLIERFRTIPDPTWYVKAIWLTAEALMDNVACINSNPPTCTMPTDPERKKPPVYGWA